MSTRILHYALCSGYLALMSCSPEGELHFLASSENKECMKFHRVIDTTATISQLQLISAKHLPAHRQVTHRGLPDKNTSSQSSWPRTTITRRRSLNTDSSHDFQSIVPMSTKATFHGDQPTSIRALWRRTRQKQSASARASRAITWQSLAPIDRLRKETLQRIFNLTSLRRGRNPSFEPRHGCMHGGEIFLSRLRSFLER